MNRNEAPPASASSRTKKRTQSDLRGRPQSRTLFSQGCEVRSAPSIIRVELPRTADDCIRFLALGDVHYPHHDPDSVELVLRFLRKWKPHVLLLMGDIFDMLPISHHEIGSGNLKKLEGQRLLRDYEEGFKTLIVPLIKASPGAYRVWVDGNHEAWALKLEGKIPGLEGMLDPFSVLNLEKYFHLHAPQGSVIYLGRLAFSHGDSIVRSGKYLACRAVERFSSSILIWHHHTFQVHTRETLSTMAYQTGISVGCLANLHPHYKPLPLHSWVHGFAYGIIHPSDGSFHVDCPVIWNRRLMAAGRIFSLQDD